MPPKTQTLSRPKSASKRGANKIPLPSESQIQEAIMNRLQMANWLVIRFNGGAFKDSYGHFIRFYIIQGLKKSAGLPDIIAFKGMQFLMIEVKDHKGELNASQERFYEFAKRFGIHVHVMRHWDDLKKVIE